jgi:NAD(P) transhydrogenase subunit beta
LVLNPNQQAVAYLVSAILFIFALKGLTHPATARRGNWFGMLGMVIAIGATLPAAEVQSYWLIGIGGGIGAVIGIVVALRIQMTAMPQLVAALHSFVGMAAVLVAIGTFINRARRHAERRADGRAVRRHRHRRHHLHRLGDRLRQAAGHHERRADQVQRPAPAERRHRASRPSCAGGALRDDRQPAVSLVLMTLLAFVLGGTLIIPIGGADMPVIISMLNSYSGWAAAATGFTLHNNLLIIVGALVGFSGAILSYIMCRAMNRSIINVVFGGFGTDERRRRQRRCRGGGEGRQIGLGRGRGLLDGGRGQGHRRARLRHGRGPGPACAEGDDGAAGGARRRGQVRHPPGRRAHAGPHERAAGRGRHPLRQVLEMDEINPEFQNTDVAWWSAPTTSSTPPPRRHVQPDLRHADPRGEDEDYVYVGRTTFHGLHKTDALTLSPQQQSLFPERSLAGELFPEYYLIKVNRFDDIARDRLDEWIYFLKHEEIAGL